MQSANQPLHFSRTFPFPFFFEDFAAASAESSRCPNPAFNGRHVLLRAEQDERCVGCSKTPRLLPLLPLLRPPFLAQHSLCCCGGRDDPAQRWPLLPPRGGCDRSWWCSSNLRTHVKRVMVMRVSHSDTHTAQQYFKSHEPCIEPSNRNSSPSPSWCA